MADADDSGDDEPLTCFACQTALDYGKSLSTPREATIYWQCPKCAKWYSTHVVYADGLDGESDLVELPGLPPVNVAYDDDD